MGTTSGQSQPGAGQQQPEDSVGEFNPLQFLIQQALLKISTIKVVSVLSVDTDAHTVGVQIAVNQLDGNNNSTPHGQIFNIPYIWAMGGTNAFMVDPAVGDLGIMVCADRDISSVKNAKAIANPGSARVMSPSDGLYLFAVPGLNGTAPTQFVKWTEDGINITAAHGNALTSGASGWKFVGNVIMENNLQLAGAIQNDAGGEYAGTIQTSGDVVAGTISLKTHKQLGVTTGGGTSGPPTP